MAENRTIHVYADWAGMKAPVQMGVLTAASVRGKEIFSFEYDKDWLQSGPTTVLDPQLQLYGGAQYNQDEQPNFGVFLDSSPDRWGRVLMKRREAIMARKEGRKPRNLFESDFLMGVYDPLRMGGLRFKTEEAGAFKSDDHQLSTPPWTSLRELEHASLQLEKEEDNEAVLKWLNLLIAPGSSLGGARPKAGVKDAKGHLWIAKFPSGNDERDIGAWEMVAFQIAKAAGADVHESMAKKFSGKHHCFLNKRFDRNKKGERIHFASAMTLLGYNDGADFHAGVSYLELAEFIIRQGALVKQDLEELWRRIVLNICIRNTDDHLRNHGFLLDESGWRLSPVYDVNPFPEGTGLTLNITEDDNSLDTEVALSVAEYFRLKPKEAQAILLKVKKAVSKWRKFATDLGIARKEQEMMEAAFTD
ncbi:MAG TPA: HipA domain-containing protein [Flavisolibacter sp.]|nr:HipA domain-containing protein [Flavisolibacter sp.]